MAKCIVYAYDVSGLRTSLKDPDLSENLYVYDDAGRLSKMQVAASRTAYFAYDASGMVVRRHAPLNEVVAYFTYDSAARLKQLENRAVTGALLSYFAYQRNALGAQTWIRHEGAEDTYFEYDPLDRLTREFRTPTGNARSHDDYYAYDAVGNRVLKVNRTASQNVYHTFDARNLLTKEWNKDAPETTYFEYDAARRMKSLKLPGGQSSYFTHDQRDQVKKIEFAKASSPDSTQEFGYTGQGERVSLKIGNGSTTDLRLAHDGEKLLTEKNAASGSATVRRYRHNRSLLDCVGSCIEWDFGGTRRYGAFNGQGTLVGLLQDFGSPGGPEVFSDSILRDAFGKLVTRGTVLGTDQGKLQFVTSGLLDLQLTNAQMDPLLFGGGCFLPTQGIPLGGAEEEAGLTDREKAAALVLLYLLSRNGLATLCQDVTEPPCVVTSMTAQRVPGVKTCLGYEEGALVYGGVFAAHGFLLVDGIGYGKVPDSGDLSDMFSGPGSVYDGDERDYPINQQISAYRQCLQDCEDSDGEGFPSIIYCQEDCALTHFAFRRPRAGEQYSICLDVKVSNCCDVAKFKNSLKSFIESSMNNPSTTYGILLNNCHNWVEHATNYARRVCGDL